MKYDVIVIGAGAAGLLAMKYLVKQVIMFACLRLLKLPAGGSPQLKKVFKVMLNWCRIYSWQIASYI
jgi:Phytoene dehydrogenase and related proteins